MSDPILPVVGSSGFYELAPPFNALVVDKIEYTCQAVRRINDYLANNEPVKEDIYTKQGLDDTVWEADVAANAYIVSLQSRTGHWLYVPYRYILGYPSVNGVPYRSMILSVSLPSLPLNQDLTAVLADVKDLVQSSLGVTVNTKLVETSKAVLVPYDKHVIKQQQRATAAQGQVTMYAQNVALRRENDALIAKLNELETYLKTLLAP